MTRQEFKLLLTYSFLILALIKFFIVPLKNKVEDKKRIYEEYVEIYFHKKNLLEKKKEAIKGLTSNQSNSQNIAQTDILYQSLYAKSEDPIVVQLSLLEEIKKLAEEQKLEVLSSHLLPLSYRDTLVEIPVSFKIKGAPKNIFEFFKKLQTFEKTIYFKEVIMHENRRIINLDLTLSVLKSDI